MNGSRRFDRRPEDVVGDEAIPVVQPLDTGRASQLTATTVENFSFTEELVFAWAATDILLFPTQCVMSGCLVLFAYALCVSLSLVQWNSFRMYYLAILGLASLGSVSTVILSQWCLWQDI